MQFKLHLSEIHVLFFKMYTRTYIGLLQTVLFAFGNWNFQLIYQNVIDSLDTHFHVGPFFILIISILMMRQ